MEKPKPVKEVAIEYASKANRDIFFFASKDAMEDIKDFGNIYEGTTYLVLHVDARFNFDEVVKYIEEYDV